MDCFKPVLSLEDIDANGSSNTDTEEESDFNLILYHFHHKDDADDEDDDSSMEMKKQLSLKTSSRATSTQKTTENETKITSTTVESDDETSNETQHSIEQTLLFKLQQEFRLKWIPTSFKYHVYGATHPSNPNEQLALKILFKKKHAIYPPMELRILSYLRHRVPESPFFQQLRGFLETDGAYGILSPFGTSLKGSCFESKYHTQNNNSNHQNTIKMIIFQLLLALKQLHSLGVMHRDIKHSNLLWNNNQLTLIDFGDATWNSENRIHFKIRGTPGYIAPEILAFERDCAQPPKTYDSKIDIYSAGVVYGCLLFNITEEDISEVHVSVFRGEASALLSDKVAAALLCDMIKLDPVARLSADQLLTKYAFYFSG